MALTPGDKVHIITRRLFESDLRRHFAGVVEETSGALIKVKGYAFVFDEAVNEFVRRDEERLRIFPMSEAGLIINVLPKDTDIEAVRYQIDEQGRRIVTDGKGMSLNISEFGARR